MKGIKKIGSFALSAAMVAGLSTPVFASGTTSNTTQVTGGVTYTVTDADDNIIATTEVGTKVYDLNGENPVTTTSSATKNTLELHLVEGAVKQLNATASGTDKEVQWGYDLGSTDAAEKKAVTVDSDGTITVNTDDGTSSSEPIVLYAYTADSLNGNNVDVTKAITVNVYVEKLTGISLEFANKDTVYTTNDESSVTALYDKDDDLPEVTHSTAELKGSGSVHINHVAMGASATFNVSYEYGSNVSDDSDYNSLVKYTSDDPNFVSVTKASDSTGKVTVVGTGNSNGLARVYATLKKDYTTILSGSNYLYVISDESDSTPVYRLYNSNTGEHLYTVDANEALTLSNGGWNLEGINWNAPTSGTAVVRLYNSHVAGGEHVYTTDANEVAVLVAAGWTNEGTKFYSATSNYIPVYREYNPNAYSNNHNYTVNQSENFILVSLGWKAEGTAFYGISEGVMTKEAALTAIDEALD